MDRIRKVDVYAGKSKTDCRRLYKQIELQEAVFRFDGMIQRR